MSDFQKYNNETKISVTSTEEIDNVIYYLIEVKIDKIKWVVKHRYKDFSELHESLVNDHGVAKDTLPPKKVIRNKCPNFIEKRREGLEEYLKNLLVYLQKTMPREFATFLDMDKYDILFLLQSMAINFFNNAETYLQNCKSFKFTPLELYAISQRLPRPCPPLELTETQYDFSHILDFCSQLKDVIIEGSVNQKSFLKTSNIIPNELTFEMSVFKNIQKLEVIGIPMGNIYSTGTMRETLRHLCVNNTGAEHIYDILLPDVVHKQEFTSSHTWKSLTEADFSYNEIKDIDDSIKLMPSVKTLNLVHNKLSDVKKISNLSQLPQLCNLNLSENHFYSCADLHTSLGNIVCLDLSQNFISSLSGLSKLYSLESLDVSCNKITDIKEIVHIGSLPCLENVRITGNPLSCIVDYRVKVLELFNARANDINLDNEKPTVQELDKVRVLQALRIAKEGIAPSFSSNNTSLFPNLVSSGS
ncbi:nischarin [Ctenocephalides felis]|uniref:nischarin n=1 Tax=Ctenocephalides felis TaxID=7515 RepID=UPI000E6E1D78|nr:nischarin [Ctenocephalides felis]